MPELQNIFVKYHSSEEMKQWFDKTFLTDPRSVKYISFNHYRDFWEIEITHCNLIHRTYHHTTYTDVIKALAFFNSIDYLIQK